jgi:hypothetical protein
MTETPDNALGKVAVVKKNAVVDVSKKHSAHQEMKKKIRQKIPKQNSQKKPKPPPKRTCTGYIMFSREQFPLVIDNSFQE